MPTIEENISLTKQERDEAERKFRKALKAGRKKGMSWQRLADVAGMSITGVRYLAENHNEGRRTARKAAKNGQG